MRGSIVKSIVLCALLTACGANHKSIYRYELLADSGKSITTVDAKQRVIIRSGEKFCTEPPPDVFSVYAQSLAASGNVSKGTDPTTLGVSGNLSYASSEQGATIARTQAFNLLALQVYYNCLSSLNDDAGKLDAPIDRARLQRLIPSTLAIEQLTGALRPPTVVISAGSSSGSVTGGEATVRIDDAYKAMQEAAEKLTIAKAAKATLENADPKCSAIAAKVTAGMALTDPEPDKKKKCDDADKTVADATTVSTDATAHYQALQKAGAGTGTSTAEATTIAAQIVQATVRDEKTIEKVTDAVKEIVMANTRPNDEIAFFCMRMISDPKFQDAALKVSGGAQVAAQCADYLLKGVESETNKLFGISGAAAEARFRDEFVQTDNAIRIATDERFALYWASIVDPATRASSAEKISGKIAAAVKTLELSAPTAARLEALGRATDFGSAREAFAKLPSSLQTTLAQ
jgi:hypothetical protein